MRGRGAAGVLLALLVLGALGVAAGLTWGIARLGMPSVVEAFLQVCIWVMLGSMLAGPWRRRPYSEAQVRAALREERRRRRGGERVHR